CPPVPAPRAGVFGEVAGGWRPAGRERGGSRPARAAGGGRLPRRSPHPPLPLPPVERLPRRDGVLLPRRGSRRGSAAGGRRRAHRAPRLSLRPRPPHGPRRRDHRIAHQDRAAHRSPPPPQVTPPLRELNAGRRTGPVAGGPRPRTSHPRPVWGPPARARAGPPAPPGRQPASAREGSHGGWTEGRPQDVARPPARPETPPVLDVHSPHARHD